MPGSFQAAPPAVAAQAAADRAHRGSKPVLAMREFFTPAEKYTGASGNALATLHERMQAAIELQLRMEEQTDPPGSMRLSCANLALDFVNVALAMDSTAYKMAKDTLLEQWRDQGRAWDAQTLDKCNRRLLQFYLEVMWPGVNRVFGGLNAEDNVAYDTLSMHRGPKGEHYSHGKPSFFLQRLAHYRDVMGRQDTDAAFYEKAIKLLPTCMREELVRSKYQHLDVLRCKLDFQSFRDHADQVFMEAMAEASNPDVGSTRKYGTEAKAREIAAAGRFPYVPLVLYGSEPAGGTHQQGQPGVGSGGGI